MRARLVGGLGALATLVAAGVVFVPGVADSLTTALSVVESRDPERASAADRTRTGEAFDARVEAACDGDGRALRAVESNLADAAASAYARRADCPPDEAESAVATGAWTDDRTAAALLGDESGPHFSLVARLRAWLDPAAERRRRVERAVEAVGRVLDDERDAGEPAGTDSGGS